jgi:hypothetical protein
MTKRELVDAEFEREVGLPPGFVSSLMHETAWGRGAPRSWSSRPENSGVRSGHASGPTLDRTGHRTSGQLPSGTSRSTIMSSVTTLRSEISRHSVGSLRFYEQRP